MPQFSNQEILVLIVIRWQAPPLYNFGVNYLLLIMVEFPDNDGDNKYWPQTQRFSSQGWVGRCECVCMCELLNPPVLNWVVMIMIKVKWMVIGRKNSFFPPTHWWVCIHSAGLPSCETEPLSLLIYWEVYPSQPNIIGWSSLSWLYSSGWSIAHFHLLCCAVFT